MFKVSVNYEDELIEISMKVFSNKEEWYKDYLNEKASKLWYIGYFGDNLELVYNESVSRWYITGCVFEYPTAQDAIRGYKLEKELRKIGAYNSAIL